MDSNERLSQTELLLAETMAILDRHTAQLKQHTVLLTNLTQAVTQQSDSISFLLREMINVKTQQNEMQADLNQVKEQQTGMDSKLDLILGKLDRLGS